MENVPQWGQRYFNRPADEVLGNQRKGTSTISCEQLRPMP